MFARTPLALALGLALLSDGAQAVAATADAAGSDYAAADGDRDGAGDARRRLDQIVVTATRGSKAVEKIPGAVTVITRQDLDDQLLIAEDLGQMLANQIPGYAPSRQKLTSFGESLRGRAPLILFDGIPQTNPLRAGAREGYFADPALIERVEVVSGASAVQGLGATGGIINFISRAPRADGTRHTLDMKLGTQFAGHDLTTKAGYLLEHGGGFDALMYVGATTRGVGVDGDGRRLGIEGTQGDTQDSDALDFFGKLGFEIAPMQRLQVSLNRFGIDGDGDWRRVSGNRAAGIPTSAERGTPVGEPPRNRVRTGSVQWTHDDFAGGMATVQAYSQDFEATYGAGVFPTFQDPAIAPAGTLVDQSEIVADKYGLRMSWVRPDLWLTGLELTTGLDWLSDTSEQRLARTGRTWVPPLEFESLAPFAQIEYEWGPLTVRGGARREKATLDVATYRTLAFYGSQPVQGGERSFTQWVENLGAVWRLGGGWSAFIAYSEGFGLPDVGLVLRAVNKPDQTVEKLVALEPILTDNREVGLTWAGEVASFTASAYDSRSQLGSQVRIDNATGIGSVARVPVRVEGFEFSGDWQPARDWLLSASYARTRGKTAAAAGMPLDVDLGARSQGPDKVVAAARWAVAPGASLRLQAAHFASRHINIGRTVGTSRLEEHFDGYTVFDLGATWATEWGDFGLGIENLLDRQYIGYYSQANPGGTTDDYFAGRGRTFTLSWRRSFD